jgi:hypothetical protein
MAGSYSAGDFHITAGPFNTVLITDPPVVSSNVVGSSAGSDGPCSAAVSNFIQTIEVLSAYFFTMVVWMVLSIVIPVFPSSFLFLLPKFDAAH